MSVRFPRKCLAIAPNPADGSKINSPFSGNGTNSSILSTTDSGVSKKPSFSTVNNPFSINPSTYSRGSNLNTWPPMLRFHFPPIIASALLTFSYICRSNWPQVNFPTFPLSCQSMPQAISMPAHFPSMPRHRRSWIAWIVTSHIFVSSIYFDYPELTHCLSRKQKSAKDYDHLCAWNYIDFARSDMLQVPLFLPDSWYKLILFADFVKPFLFRNETLHHFASHFCDDNSFWEKR